MCSLLSILCWHIAFAEDTIVVTDDDVNSIVSKYANWSDDSLEAPSPIELGAVEGGEKDGKEWIIKIDDGQTPTGYIEQYDCDEFTQFCSDTDCSLFAKSMRYLPTESIYESDKETFKEGLSLFNNEYNDAKLLCVDANMFRFIRIKYGLVEIDGSKQFVSLHFHFEHSHWTVKPIKEAEDGNYTHQKACTQAKDVCAGNEGLAQCMQNGNFPFVQANDQWPALKQLKKCDDGGKLNGIQCTEIVCTESNEHIDAANKKSMNEQPVQAIIKCNDGNQYSHQIFYHPKQKRYCLSHCDKEKIEQNDDDSCKTLEGELQRQGVANMTGNIHSIMQQYAPSVHGITFWKDAVHRINKFQKNNRENYNKMAEWHLFDYDISFRVFPKRIQSQLNKLRGCQTNCQKYTLIPWDSLQLMQNLNWIPSGNEHITNNNKPTKKNANNANNAPSKQPKPGKVNSNVGVKQIIKESDKKGKGASRNNVQITLTCMLIQCILVFCAGYVVFY